MRKILALAALCAVLGSPLCSLPAQAQDKPFKFLFIGALSGPNGPVGQFELAGYRAAADDVNGHGGILGRQIEVTALDSQGQGSQAVSLLQDKLNAGDIPDAVVAGALSNETIALLPLLSQHKIISVAITTSTISNNPTQYPYMFLSTLRFSDFSDFLARYLKSHGHKTIGVLTSNDANGQTAAKSDADAFKKAGMDVAQGSFGDNDLDLTVPLQRLEESHPDAIAFSAVVPRATPLVLDARYKIGADTPVFLDVSLTTDVATLMPPNEQKNIFIAHMKVAFYVPPEQRTPLFNYFLNNIKKQGPIIGSLHTPAIAWDNVQAMALAYRQAGSMDSDKVKAAFENLRLPAPKDRRFLAFHAVHFTPTEHFNTAATDEDFGVGPLGPRIDGTFKSPGE